jgi:hypothetical protein
MHIAFKFELILVAPLAVIPQPRIQRNQFFAKVCAARGRLQTRIPFHPNLARECRGAELAQNRSRFLFERVIAPAFEL